MMGIDSTGARISISRTSRPQRRCVQSQPIVRSARLDASCALQCDLEHLVLARLTRELHSCTSGVALLCDQSKADEESHKVLTRRGLASRQRLTTFCSRYDGLQDQVERETRYADIDADEVEHEQNTRLGPTHWKTLK